MQQPEPGDLYVFKNTSSICIEWLVVHHHPDNHESILLAPCDDFFMIGTPDVDITESMNRRFIVRCGETDWFPTSMCQEIPKQSTKVGKVPKDALKLVQQRMAQLARGTIHKNNIDDSADIHYEEFIEEIMTERIKLLNFKAA